jgi:predicted aminopeptidase
MMPPVRRSAACRVRLPVLAGLLAAAALAAAGCATDVGYLWKQGGYLLSYSSGARDIESVLRDPRTDAGTRSFLLEVGDIKAFAEGTLGLARNANYSRYREVRGNHLADVVQACDAASFDAYQWSYPVLGRLPYKGFYERADAEAEAARLRAKGFDTVVRGVDAFSTLGFLRDPLYSFMKGYPPDRLASLVIHEQTHATVFLRGQAQFNEELASFVGDEGALRYLGSRYGAGSREVEEALSSAEDSALFLDFTRELHDALQRVYSSPASREEKLARKKEVIDSFQERYRTVYGPRFHGDAYRPGRPLPLNNAYLSLFSLYNDDVPLIRRYFERVCSSRMPDFITRVKGLARSGGDVPAAMRAALGEAGG